MYERVRVYRAAVNLTSTVARALMQNFSFKPLHAGGTARQEPPVFSNPKKSAFQHAARRQLFAEFFVFHFSMASAALPPFCAETQTRARDLA